VEALFSAGRRQVHELWVAGDTDDGPLANLVELAAEHGTRVQRTDWKALAKRAGTESHQGALAVAEPLKERELDDLAAGPAAFLVALDGVTDPHNVGAVMRTAESSGATGCVLARHGGPAVTPTVAKAAAGAIEHLPIAVVPRIPAALERLKSQGVWVVGLDGEGDADLFDLQLLTEPVVLVLGSEGEGMSRLSAARCDLIARIPRIGQTPSLNVSAAAALACFEVVRARR
jgi:23S rRNA (guanosine2251-2'-O)-methyltransferase